jgi:hypothetical protein
MEQQLTVSQLRRSKAGSTLKVSQSPNKEDVIRKRMLNVIWKRSIPALTAKRSTASTFIACPWRNAWWNKNYKGYCFTSICNELMINFKP